MPTETILGKNSKKAFLMVMAKALTYPQPR
jgi:hypothetical protein